MAALAIVSVSQMAKVQPFSTEKVAIMCCGKSRIWGYVAIAIGIFTACSAHAQKVELRNKFTKGEKYQHQMTQNITMEMKIQGQEMKMDMKQGMLIDWAVKEVSGNGEADIEQMISRMTMEMESPFLGGKVGIDTDDEKAPDNQIAAQLKDALGPMVKKPFKLKINPLGKILDVQVPEDALSGIEGTQIAQFLGDLASEDGLKNITRDASLEFPEGGLKKGDTFERTLSAKSGQGITTTTKTTYTYQGKNDKGLEQFDTVVEMDMKADENSPAQFKIKSQDNKGKLLVDPKNGRIVSNLLSQNVEIEAEVMGQTIEQKMTGDVKMELVPAGSSGGK